MKNHCRYNALEEEPEKHKSSPAFAFYSRSRAEVSAIPLKTDFMSNEQSEDILVNEKLGVSLRVLPGTRSVYTQLASINPGFDEVIISFFEVQPPTITGPEALEQLKKTGLVADCVARVVMSPKRFLEFAALIASTAKDCEREIREGTGEHAEST